VWKRYLIQYIRWVNEIEPDVVVVTGDLITGGYRFAHRIATILMHLKATHGVICTLGNHGLQHLREHHRKPKETAGRFFGQVSARPRIDLSAEPNHPIEAR